MQQASCFINEKYMTTAEQTIISCPEHCWKLSEFFSDATMFPDKGENAKATNGCSFHWSDISDHLKLAASLTQAEVDTTRYDDSAWICKGAWNYEVAKSKELSTFVTELARFNFIWNALENTVAVIRPRSVSGSQIDAACRYLKDFYEPEPAVLFYVDALVTLRVKLRNHNGYKALEKEFGFLQTEAPSIGLHVVRKLRNRFAHGAGILPLPIQGGEQKSIDAEIVQSSSRLLLFTIQHLALAFFKGNDFSVPCGKSEDDFLCDVEADKFLRNLHLADDSEPFLKS